MAVCSRLGWCCCCCCWLEWVSWVEVRRVLEFMFVKRYTFPSLSHAFLLIIFSAASQTPTQHCLEIPPMCLLPQCTQWLHIPILLHQCSQKQLTEPRPRSCVLMIYLSKPLHPPFRRKSLAPRCQLHPLPVNSWARLAMKTRIFFHSLSNVYYPRFTKKRPSHSELRRQRALEKRKNWNFSFCLLLSLLTPPPPNQPPTPSWQATIFVLMGY